MSRKLLAGAGCGALLGILAACSGQANSAEGSDVQPKANASSEASNPALWPEVESDLIDADIEARIDELLQKMTLEQKVGQVIQADNGSITPEEVKRYRIGSVLSGGNSGPDGKPYGTVEEWVAATDAYYRASVDPEGVEVAIPIIWGIDAVHGHNTVIGGTLFPHNIGLGAAHDPELIQRIGVATAAEIAGSGIEWTFAPTLAVPQDLRWSRSYEGYAADPALVKAYSKAMVEGLQGDLLPGKPLGSVQVAATAKHFLADGGTENGKDQGDARLPEAELIRIHAQGYPAAIDAGALTVMARCAAGCRLISASDRFSTMRSICSINPNRSAMGTNTLALSSPSSVTSRENTWW